MKLRPHQIDCISAIDSHIKKNENVALVKMFCGSGKSMIIYHCLLAYGGNLSIVVVPSINLITQFNRDYLLDEYKKSYNKTNFNKEFELLTICSKNDLEKGSKLKITTEPDEILDFLELGNEKIILVTYQSLKTLVDIIKENDI